MTDWGAHHFGGAMFAIDCRELQPVEVTYHDDNGKEYLTYRYPNGILLTTTARHGNLQVEGTPGEKRRPKPVPTYKGHGGIYGDFIDCVKTAGKALPRHRVGHRTPCAVCHLGNIAYELKRR